MKYNVVVSDNGELANISAALKILDPEAEIVAGLESCIRLVIDWKDDFWVNLRLESKGVTMEREFRDTDIADPRYNQADRRQRRKELTRRGVIATVGDYLQKRPSWGILSGVRPTKIYHYLRDKGFEPDEVKQKLLTVYGLNPGKAQLLAKIAAAQEKFFTPPRVIGIYVGIPFCPTRCHYCSFAAVSLETHAHLVPGFLSALHREIETVGAFCRESAVKIQSIYIGGGTPTSLAEDAFAQLLTWLTQAFPAGPDVEFTVEAGRPETITPAKLAAMVDAGVNRVSVNPQTMCQATLDTIGRVHTVDDVLHAVSLVKPLPLILNMDLILGLPGENGTDFLHSLSEVMRLGPENITVHTLAPKRAARWSHHFTSLELAGDRELVAASEQALTNLTASGYVPYYLYRQRHILADLENIGYARPGTEGVYNIQMMEERQTIFGLGGGAVTKWVVGPEYRVTRHQNPKCPATYAQRLEQDLATKMREAKAVL